MTTANINTGVNSLSAVQITKKAFNAALVENTTAQIYGRSSTYNRLNDIVAAVNNPETMQQVKDGAEWRTVVKTRSNGVVFSNGSTLDYAPNNHDNDVNYYRAGNVIIMVAARRNDASDADINPFIYLVVAYLLDAPETTPTPTTPETETTTNTETAMQTTDTTNNVLATLKSELQEYYNNAAKGGANRRRNMTMLRWDIRKLERKQVNA